jgi:hypothetical protein
LYECSWAAKPSNQALTQISRIGGFGHGFRGKEVTALRTKPDTGLARSAMICFPAESVTKSAYPQNLC